MKTVFWGVGTQGRSQRMRRSAGVAWCHSPSSRCPGVLSFSASWERKMQGGSDGSVRFVVVSPAPRSFANVRPDVSLWGSGIE